MRAVAVLLLGIGFGLPARAGPGAAAPVVWFSPQAPDPRGGFAGAPDFMALFAPGAPWRRAAAHVNVLKLSTEFMIQVPEPELAAIVSWLGRHRIKLAIESLAQNWVGQRACGQGVEGYADPAGAARAARNLRRAGGTLAYIAMDEPLYYGHDYSGPHACHSPVRNIAERVAEILRQYRSVFPGVVIGDIEPDAVALRPGAAATYARWVTAFRAAVGVRLAFLHVDVNWNRPDHLAGLVRSAAIARANGLTLGVIYNGKDNDRSDLRWLADMRANAATVERTLGGPPPTVIFQSWVAYPSHLLPETSPGSFTYGIESYFHGH